MIKAVIFDFDLTLVDSLRAITLGLNKMATRFNLPQVQEHDTRRVMSFETQDIWRNLWGHYDPAWEVFFNEHVDTQEGNYLDLATGAVELLTKLKNSGCALGLATNRTNAWAALTSIGLANYFDTAVGISDVERGKPAPDMLNLAVRQLGYGTAQTIYIGDATYDMEAANRAGIRGVGILSGGTPAIVLQQAGAWQVRADLKDLDNLFD